MASTKEIIDLVLNFSTNVKDEGSFATFLKSQSSALSAFEGDVAKTANVLERFAALLKQSANLKKPGQIQIFNHQEFIDVKDIAVNSVKEITTAVESLQNVFNKKIEFNGFTTFIEGIGKTSKILDTQSVKWQSTIQKAFADFSVNNTSLEQFFENLIPPGLQSKSKEKVAKALAGIKEEIKNSLGDISNLTVEQRVTILDTVAEKLLAGSGKIATVSTTIKDADKLIVDAISALVVHFTQLKLEPPKELFDTFNQNIAQQASQSGTLLKEITKNLETIFTAQGLEFKPTSKTQKSILTALGLDPNEISSLLKSLRNDVVKDLDAFYNSINQQGKNVKIGTELRQEITALQKFITDNFVKNSSSFGADIQDQFKKASEGATAFSATTDNNLKSLNNFIETIQNLINSLKNSGDAGKPLVQTLSKVLEAYLQVESKFRFGEILDNQKAAFGTFEKQITDFFRSINNQRVPDFQIKYVTGVDQGQQAIDAKTNAMRQFNDRAEDAQLKLQELNRRVLELQNIRAVTPTEDLGKVDDLISKHNSLRDTIEKEIAAIETSKVAWTTTWKSKVEDIKFAEDRVKNFQEALNGRVGASGILEASQSVKAFLDIAIGVENVGVKYKDVFQIFERFNGVSPEALRNLNSFQSAINELFKAQQKGGTTVTLLDTSQMIRDSEGAYTVNNKLRESLLSLAGASQEAQNSFSQLATVQQFLKDIGQSSSEFGKQVDAMYQVANGAREYLGILDRLKERAEQYREASNRVSEAQITLQARLEEVRNISEENRSVQQIQAIEAAYKNYQQAITATANRLKNLEDLQNSLQQNKEFSTTSAVSQVDALGRAIGATTATIVKNKETIEAYRSDTQLGDLFKNVTSGIDAANANIKTSLTTLQQDLAGRLNKTFESLFAKTSVGDAFRESIERQIKGITDALKTGNVEVAIGAIKDLLTSINVAFKVDKGTTVSPEFINIYLEPFKQLLSGLETVRDQIARKLPQIYATFGEQNAAPLTALLGIVKTEIKNVSDTLNSVGKQAGSDALTQKFEQAKKEAETLTTTIKNLNGTTLSSTDLEKYKFELSQIRSVLASILREDKKTKILDKSEIENVSVALNIARQNLNDLGKTKSLESIQNDFTRLQQRIPNLNNDIADLGKLLQTAFNTNVQTIDIKPYQRLKELLSEKTGSFVGTEKAAFEALTKSVNDTIEKVTLYNSTVKIGSTRSAGVGAIVDRAVTDQTTQALKQVDEATAIASLQLQRLASTNGITALSAKQLVTEFKAAETTFDSLGTKAGGLTGTSENLAKVLRSLSTVQGAEALVQFIQQLKDDIDQAIKLKEQLTKQFASGFTQKLEQDLERLTRAKELLDQFGNVAKSFENRDFFSATSYGARQTYEELQRLEKEMRTVRNALEGSLSVGRSNTLDPTLKTQLEAQEQELTKNIAKITQYRAVYDQLRSQVKIEEFERLKTVLSEVFSTGNINSLRQYTDGWKLLSSDVRGSIASITTATEPLTQTIIDNFKKQSDAVKDNLTAWRNYANILRTIQSSLPAGQSSIQLPNGSNLNVERTIKILDLLITSAEKVSPAINQASDALGTRLGTATGQAEVRVSNLIAKFGDLQDRINNLNPGSSINQMYGSIKELMLLLDQPYKSGPFFTLPKESFAPIRNEILGLLETAKQLQGALSLNLGKLDSGSTAFKETEAAIKAAKDEVERLSAAMQRLSEYEKNASHFSTLRAGLHGASTTLQELAHEGAFIYKGLEALFKNLAKNLTIPTGTLNTTSINQQLDELTTKFNVTGKAADHLKTQVREAINAQLGGGGLAAAEQYQKAFQQLEEAFVKFRSGLTQAAMGFQMLGDSLLEPFKKAKERFEEFSDTMGVVNAVTNATQAQFKALTDQALLMGATTRFTAEQAAEGLKALAKAGFTAEEQIAALPAVMRLAQAAATDLATAASISTVVMKEFRMDPEQFNEAADKITLAANRTLGTVEDLGFAFKYVGALAANVGADFGDLTAAIGLLQNAGLKGTLAGTALRGMLMALYNPTRDEQKLIADLSERIGGLGLQIQDASGKFVGYGKIVKQLEQAGITTGEVLRFFGQRAGPGMAALLAQGSEALQKLEGDLRSAEGTTAHMAEIMEQTLKGRLLLMRSAFEALSDSIGHNLAPTLAAAANAMADFVSRFVAVRQEFPVLATAVDHVLAGFALFASVLGGLAVTFAFIIVPVRQFMGFLKTLIVTTLAGAGAITSLSAAQAFNAKVTAATMVAVEAEFRARIAQAGATAGATAAINYNSIAAGINVVAIREQTAALLGATAAAGANAAVQGSMWVGLKNTILGLGRNLLNIGGMLRFAFLNPLGLVLTAITGVVAYTLLHEKSVSQTNVELDKQSQIIEYNRKNVVKLNEELLSSIEQLKRNQQALNELRSGEGPERNLLGDKDQTTAANLQLDIDKGKKDIQKQLKELFTQITESATYKDLVNFKIEFDASGAFKQFTTVLKDGNKEFEILGDNLQFNTDQLQNFTKELDDAASAQKRKNAEEKIANELSLLAQQKLSKETFGQIGSQFKNPFAFDTDFEEKTRKIATLNSVIQTYSKQIEKLKKGANIKDIGFNFTFADIFKTPTNEEAIKRLEALRLGVYDRLAKLNVDTNSQMSVFVNNFVKILPEILEKGLDEIAVQNADNPEIVKNILDGVFNLKNFDRAAFDPLYNAIQAQLNERNKNLTTEQLVGDNLKKPVIGLVSATKDLVAYLEETNKELKKKIDDQKKIFDEAKVVVDAVKAYQTAIAAAAKDTFDLRNQEIEFEAKFKLDNLDQSFEEKLRELEDNNRVIELPFKAKLITGTTDTSGFKALSSLSGMLLDYEKKNTAEFVKIQSENSQRIKEIKLIELKDKQAAITKHYQTLKDLYTVDSADYLKAQQEQQNATKENLDARLQAVQEHLKNLLKLYQDNAKAIIDLEKQKKQFQAAIEQTRVNFGNAQLLPTEQLQKAKFDLATLDAQIQTLLKEEKFDDAIARLNEYQKLVDEIATSAGAQPELTLKVANLAENLEFDLDRIDFEKEFNKANIRITTGAQGLSEAFNSTFTKFKPLSNSFVPQLEDGNVNIRKALQTAVKIFDQEGKALQKHSEDTFEGVIGSFNILKDGTSSLLKSFGESAIKDLRFTETEKEVERFGDMMEDIFNVRPNVEFLTNIDELQGRLKQVGQAQDALREVTAGKPGIPLLTNLSETGEKGIITLRNVKGEMIALSLQAQTKIKPLEGLTTDIQKSQEALVGFKSLIDTQIEDLSRGDKVVELPISFKADFNAFDTASLGKYSAEVLSYEKNLNKEVLALQLKRINATLDEEKKASEQKRTVVENQINIVTSQYNQQLGAMQNWSKQDLDAYKSNIESKKSSLISFLQEELSATQATYNELFQIRANLLNKNKSLDEQYISFQANATKNLQTIDDLGKSDSQKTYETRLKSINLQADADAALAQEDYDRAKALLEQRQQLIDAAVSSLKPEDTIGKFFLKQDQTEAVASYKKVTDALKLQNQAAIKDVEAQLNSVNGQIAALKQSADTAKAALQELLNKLFELSTKKFQAEVEVVQKNTKRAESLGEQAYSGAIAQRQDIGKGLLQDREKVKKEEQALLNLYKEQVIELRKTINIVKEKQLIKIGIDPESYDEVLEYAQFYLDSMEAIGRDDVNRQLARTKLADLQIKREELQKSKQAANELLLVEKQLNQVTASQKELSGLVGYSNTLNTATNSARQLQDVLNKTNDTELDTEQLTAANTLLEALRKSAQAVQADFEKTEVPESTKTRLEAIFALFGKDVSLLKEDELKDFISQAATALSDLEGFQRDANDKIAGEAKSTALNTIAEVQASLLKIESVLKDAEIRPDVKGASLLEIRKRLEDQLQGLQFTIDTADKKGNQAQIEALKPLKDLLLKVNKITKDNVSDEEKITRLLNIKNELAKKQKELTSEQLFDAQKGLDAAEQQKRIQERNLAASQAQSKATQDIVKSQEAVSQATEDTATAWAKATPNEQFNALNDIQNKVDEISKAGLQLTNPEEQKQIADLFNQLKNAQAGLSAAFETGDLTAITKAITKIKELGIQFKNAAGLSENARKKFSELANIPSFDIAIKVNTSSILPAEERVQNFQDLVQQDVNLGICCNDANKAVDKLKDVVNEVEKLKALSAVEFKGTTQVDVTQSKATLSNFAQEAQRLLAVPVNLRDDAFNASLQKLLVNYEQFRSTLQPVKLEIDTVSFDAAYNKAVSTLRELKDTANIRGAANEAERYSQILNELMNAKINTNSTDLKVKTQGYENIKRIITGTKELKNVITEANQKALIVEAKSIGKEVVVSDLVSVQNELDATKNKARQTKDVLAEIGQGLSDVATKPKFETPQQEFGKLNTRINSTLETMKKLSTEGQLDPATLDSYKIGIEKLITQVGMVPGVTEEMLTALRSAAGVEIQSLIKPEAIKEVERVPSQLEAIGEPTVTVKTQVTNQEAITNLQNLLFPITENPIIADIHARADQALSTIGNVVNLLKDLPKSDYVTSIHVRADEAIASIGSVINLLKELDTFKNISIQNLIKSEAQKAIEELPGKVEAVKTAINDFEGTSLTFNLLEGLDTQAVDFLDKLKERVFIALQEMQGKADVGIKIFTNTQEMDDFIEAFQELSRGFPVTFFDANEGRNLSWLKDIQALVETPTTVRVIPIVEDTNLVIFSKKLDEILLKGYEIDPKFNLEGMEGFEQLEKFRDAWRDLTDPTLNNSSLKVSATVENQESVTNLQNQVSWLTDNPFVTTINALADEAINTIGTMIDYLNELPSLRTIEIHTRYTSSGDSSGSSPSTPVQNENKGGLIGSLQYFADGGLARFKELFSAVVPGTGNTDTVPAMLTPGEFVIKKERVKELGLGFLNSLNKGLIQFKSMGGMVYNSPINTLNKMSGYIQPKVQMPQEVAPASGPPIDINLTIKDKTFNIKTPRAEAGKLVAALQYLERGIK